MRMLLWRRASERIAYVAASFRHREKLAVRGYHHASRSGGETFEIAFDRHPERADLTLGDIVSLTVRPMQFDEPDVGQQQ
jgi:hypothetical protein